jgi:predicted DNA-binding transcriptional regulator YafY
MRLKESYLRLSATIQPFCSRVTDKHRWTPRRTQVLSYGGAAIVLAPDELKEQAREWAAAIVAQYE